ncbi:hypothetical protein EC957_007224 [Mortierella hygrophila]|uniref:AMP-dependent synthetase/ligase domain-containing protein n=1 Tax=Mortierella hygrophila TaxID=979708 RepID=A0A9P6JYJ4_9FUNG|nr:hypothetical protein EC957_007224 [Mortierella hygrophila]
MVSVTGALALVSAALYLDGRTRFSRDLHFGIPGLRTKLWFQKLVNNNDISMYNRFEDQCLLRPHSVALIFEDHSYTWRNLELASNRMAHWYKSRGISSKDRVAMFMSNSPLFVISWLALLKIKAVAAFINNQIVGPVLLHSLKSANSDVLVFDYELRGALEESILGIRELGYKTIVTVTPKDQVLTRFDEHLKGPEERFFDFMEWQQCSAEGFSRASREDVVIGDAVALIYTSGTTGFPKAAVMDHGRCTRIGQSWISGSSVVLARKFSTIGFWKDVREHDVTLIQYIGELCRYLVNTPEDPELDKAHKVRLMFGNGLRPDIWRKFQERFGVATVFESYTMSEATSALFNLTSGEDGAGAVGFRGPLVRAFQGGLRIVKVDLDTEELIKDKNGYCIEASHASTAPRSSNNDPCAPGETGELITLADSKKMENRFVGYYNQPKLSQEKLIQNVFVQGDQYMRTGDLLYRTKDNFWYFADRAGDTFRWKGENVSTAEVADTLGHVEGIASCTVYGVRVPGQDGRAGMVAVVLKDSYWEEDRDAPVFAVAAPVEQVSEVGERDTSVPVPVPAPVKVSHKLNEKALEEFMDRFSKHASKRLPSYAIPRFVRICESELEITGTFKNKKVELKKEGFDLEKVHERLYWWTQKGRYVLFGRKQLDELHAGRARL